MTIREFIKDLEERFDPESNIWVIYDSGVGVNPPYPHKADDSGFFCYREVREGDACIFAG